MQDLFCEKVSPSSSETATETWTDMAGNIHVLANDFVEQEESSIMDSQKDESSKWTNEKHSLYLKSIEASFVNQLYNSLDMQTSQTQNPFSSDAISTLKNHPNTYIPSGQFKVLQRGRWSNKCFKKENLQVKDADRSRISSGNPWIQHFTNGSLRRLSSTLRQYPVTDSRLHDQETGCSNTEVTDQNFVEETTCSRKRTKTSKITYLRSSNDQVVPGCTSEIPDSYDCSKK